MPRADPTRSAYCATRHLLRNLDDAAELRRNPLVRSCFTPPAGALDRVRGLVHASLARCRDRSAVRARPRLGRMHAALLRCEIDKQPLAVVAAELGLSDRQVRRERRAAHEAFLHAFRHSEAAPGGAIVDDTATLRLAQTEELHELGQSTLAMSACEDVAALTGRPDRRIEALCLAAEIDLDGARYAAAQLHIAEAEAVLEQRAGELDDRTRRLAAERIDLSAWSVRAATGIAGGLGAPPPRVVVDAGDGASEPDERRRGLLVRALAAYAMQRWEVGDAHAGAAAVRRAQRVLPSLDGPRVRERLAVMYADARIVGLREVTGGYLQLLAAEELADARGYVRTLLMARAERIGAELRAAGGGERVLERIAGDFDTGARRTMPNALAFAACSASQHESHVPTALAAIDLAERLLPARSGLALLARCMRLRILERERRHDESRGLAHAIRNDAEAAGNERVCGGVERYLAAIAVAQRRFGDARRHVHAALPRLERYGTPVSLEETRRIARRLGIG